MASLQPQEISRFDKEMYQSITPKKNRTFSENMARRRKPFLCSENTSNSPVIFKTPKRNLTQPQEHFKNNKNEVGEHYTNSDCEPQSPTVNLKKIFENNLTIKKTEHKTENNEEAKIGSIKNSFQGSETAVEKFTNNSADLSEISGYYSESSLNETIFISDGETSIDSVYQLEEQLPPLKNSTFIDQGKTVQSETLFSLNETETEYKTSHFEHNITNGQTKTDLNVAIQKIELNGNGDSGLLSSSNQNASIPLIIIEGFENRSKKKDNEEKNSNIVSSIPPLTENEITSLKTLNDPSNPQRKECNDNETNKLKAKLKQMKLFNQIEIKNKVMTQLMEFTNLTNSPKFKNYCNKKCEKNNNGSSVTGEMKIDAKEQGNSSFLCNMWSTIQHPFVTYTKTPEKKTTQQ